MRQYFLILLSFLFFLGAFKMPEANAQCPVQADVVLKTHTDITCFGANDGTITVDLADLSTNIPFNFELYDLGSGSIVTPSVTEIEDKPNRSVVYSSVPAGTYSVLFFKAGCYGGLPLNIIEAPFGFVIDEPLLLTLTGADVVTSCNGISDATVTFTAGDGTPAYVFSEDANTAGGIMTVNPTTLVYTNAGVGAITVTVMDANGCTAQHTINVTQPTPIVFTPAVVNASCNGLLDGSITFNAVSGGSGAGYTFSINGGGSFQAGNVFNGLAAGPYNLIVKDGSGCDSPATPVTITQPSAIIFTPAVVNASCNGLSDGSITFNAVSGGSGAGYTFSIDGGGGFQAGNVFNGLAPGPYNLIVKDGSGCDSPATPVTITQPSAIVFTPAVVNASCNGLLDGSITFNAVSGGSGAGYTFSIDGGGGFQAGNVFNGLAPGPYNLIVKDGSGCDSPTTPVTITQPSAIVFTPAVVNASCNGLLDGSITFNAVSGGSGAGYTFSIDGGGSFQASNVFNGLAAGPYNLIVKDGSGCDSPVTPVNITQPSAIVFTPATVNASCNGLLDGSITFNAVSGGSGAGYTFSINGGGSFQGSNVFNGLAAGPYNLIVKDGSGCDSPVTPATITEPSAIVFTPAVVNASCNGLSDGSITFNAVSGGSGAGYTFSINGGGSFQGSNVFNGLAAGPYNLIVKDGSGCDSPTTPVTITQPSAIVFTPIVVNASCNGVSNGSITFNAVSGGSGAGYTFSINGGGSFQASNVFNGLAAGPYNLIVKDGSGCDSPTTPVTITQPSAIIFTPAVVNVSCNGLFDGSITFNAVSGGSGAGYTFSIDGGGGFQAGNVFNGLAPGPYNLIVKDGSGCDSPVTPITLTEPAILTFTFTKTDLICNGGSSGTITITAGGGTGPYQYSINNGVGFQVSNAFVSLIAGNYNLVVKDNNNCTTAATPTTLTEPSVVMITGTTKTDATCLGLNDGVIQINSSGGTGIHRFSIDNGAMFQASNTFTGLAPAAYNAIVQDANGCLSAATPIIINNASPITITTTSASNATCIGVNDGSIDVTGVTGGSGTYTYSNDNGVTFQSGSSFATLSVSSYDMVVKDGNNCLSSPVTVVVGNNTIMTFATTPVGATCLGVNDGSISITGETGGSTPYNYSVNNGATFQASPSFSSLPPGSYDVLIRDMNLCLSSTSTIVVVSGTTITVSAVTTTDTCGGLNDGSINVTSVSGGVTPYMYSVDNGATYQAASLFTSLAASSYDVMVMDNNGCVSATQIEVITIGATVTATVNKIDATCADNDGSITISNELGGTGPYQYSIDNGASFQAVGVYTGLTNGAYNVVVMEVGGCLSGVQPISINLPSSCVPTGNCATVVITPVPTAAICSPTDGSIMFNINPATPTINNTGVKIDIVGISASNSGVSFTNFNSPLFSGLPIGTYNYTIEYGDLACIKAGQVTVLLGPDVVDFTVAPNSVNCFGTAGGVILSNINGSSLSDYTYEVTQSGAVVLNGTITQLASLGNVTVAGLGSGNFEIKLSQDQSATTSCTSPVQSALKPFSVTSPTAALDTLYVTKKISVPDLPTGSITVGIAESLQEPYEVRLELTQPIIPGQEFAQDFTIANRNPLNLKVEFQAANLFAGVYQLSLRDALGCRKDYLVTVPMDNNLMIPNIFTPNGDNKNEVFFIRNMPDATEVMVSNRWGKQVYSSKNYQNDWDGGDVADGVYYYRIKAGGQSYSGWVEVMRGK